MVEFDYIRWEEIGKLCTYLGILKNCTNLLTVRSYIKVIMGLLGFQVNLAGFSESILQK